MKNLLKYLFLIGFLGLFFYVLLEQWIPVKAVLLSTCLLLTAAGFILIKRHVSDWQFHKFLLIAGFLFCIYTPMAGKKETESLEKRTLTAFPEFRWGNVWKFLKEYQRYFDDRFAFRNDMLAWNGKIKLHVLNTSTDPEKLEIGKENWLFSSGKSYHTLTSTPFTESELKLMELNMEIMTRWLAERNIKYYFVSPPIKARIYPEKMYDGQRKLYEYSKLEQLYTYLKGNKALNFIDVREELTEGKKIRDTYLKTDTHWNQFGAFLSYQKIMSVLRNDFPQLRIHDISEYRMDSAFTGGGDLLMFMGLTQGISFPNYNMELKSGVRPVAVDSTSIPWRPLKTEIRAMPDSVNGLRLVVIRDSFTEFLKIFLSTSFDRVTYAWTTTVPVSVVMYEKPDIVVHEIMEMFLNRYLRLPPEIYSDKVFMNTHYPGYDSVKNQVNFSLLFEDENP